ncbi:hypothetical protein ACFLUL_01910 [Chloroflexota bacterium]
MNKKKELFNGLFIAMIVITAINTIVAFTSGVIIIGVLNCLVLLGIIVYFVADWMSS